MGWEQLNAPLPDRPSRVVSHKGAFLCQRDPELEARAVGAIKERELLEKERWRRHQAIINQLG